MNNKKQEWNSKVKMVPAGIIVENFDPILKLKHKHDD